MTKFSHQEFAERLLQQEQRVSKSDMADFRRGLDQKLAKAASHERRMRIAILALASIAGLSYLALLISASFGVHLPLVLMDSLPDLIAATIVALSFAAAICVIPFIFLYFFHYKRRLQQTQHEQLLATLAELERQNQELRSKLPNDSE